jgi:transposase
MAHRSYGTGSLFIRRDVRGREYWYGQWWSGTRRPRRKLGPKRAPGSRDGLTRSQAERKLRQLIERESAAGAVAERRLSVAELGQRYVDHREQVMERKRTTLQDYRIMLRRHLSAFFADKSVERHRRRRHRGLHARQAPRGARHQDDPEPAQLPQRHLRLRDQGRLGELKPGRPRRATEGRPNSKRRLRFLQPAELVACLAMFDRKLTPRVEEGRMHPRLEVTMRPPSVFVRPLDPEEAQRLKRLAKRAKHFSTRQRAGILLASAAGLAAPEIARMWMTDASHVRKVITDFNERGFDSLRPDYRGGRPRRITAEQRERIVAVAGARPEPQGSPHTRWSLRRLSAHLAGEGIQVSPAQLGRVLAEAGLSFQRTRSWKASPDPDYEAKTRRLIALCKRPPEDGVVVGFDQMGPHSLRPTHGSGWATRKRPQRLRGDFNRRHGIRYVFGAYDVHADRLRTRLRPRRRGPDVLAFPRQIRLCYPRRLRIYWIQDNLSANWTKEIRAFAAANNIELVATPDLRPLPQPGRVPLPADPGVRLQQRRLPRLGGGQLRARASCPLPQRRAPRPPA